MIENAIIVAGTAFSVFMMAKQKKARLDPLKNAEKIVVSINTEVAVDQLQIYLPPPHFIKNMRSAVEKEQAELVGLWSQEKNVFPLLWRKMTKDRRKALLSSLVDELIHSIGAYSDADKLLGVLCPKITAEHFTSIDANAKAETPESEKSTALFKFLLAAQSKTDIKPYCLPLIILSVTRVEGDVDPNRDEKEDAKQVLEEHTETFLRALQHLCAIKYAKQVLLRYKVDPTASFFSRAVKKVAPVLVLGVLAMLLGYLLDRFGFMNWFFVGYVSPFN